MSLSDIRVVMVGKTGAGKSAVGNTILGFQAFESLFLPESVTVDCKKVRGVVDGRNVYVVDTPGLCDTRHSEDTVINEIKKCICFAAPGPHVFLVVIRLSRYTPEEQKAVQIIQEVFGERSNKYTMILFTGGDELNGKPVEGFLEPSLKLKELIKTCDGRYHVFNNNTGNPFQDPSQVTKLLKKIDSMVKDNGGNYYTTEMLQEAEREIKKKQQMIIKDKEKEIYDELKRLKKTYGPKDLKQEETKLKTEHQQRARELAETNNSFLSNYKIDSVFKAAKALAAHVVEKDKGAEMKNEKCSIQ